MKEEGTGIPLSDCRVGGSEVGSGGQRGRRAGCLGTARRLHPSLPGWIVALRRAQAKSVSWSPINIPYTPRPRETLEDLTQMLQAWDPNPGGGARSCSSVFRPQGTWGEGFCVDPAPFIRCCKEFLTSNGELPGFITTRYSNRKVLFRKCT